MTATSDHQQAAYVAGQAADARVHVELQTGDMYPAGSPDGVINTSDKREKQQVQLLSQAEKNVAITLKGLIRTFKWNKDVVKDGDSAKIHFGVMAQDVLDAFTTQGLDYNKYGLVTYEEWEEELNTDGSVALPSGNRYGVRYSELLAFIIGSI